jgi:hypothetical protein
MRWPSLATRHSSLVTAVSASFQVTIQDHASPAIRAMAARLTPRRLAAAVGPACARATRRHLAGLPSNRQGWPTTFFWQRAAKATHWAAEPEGAVISISQVGVRQRFQGGRIRAVNRKFLSIPAVAEAYGRTAAEFPNLRFAVLRPGGPALVETAASEIRIGPRRKDGSRSVTHTALRLGGGVVFWLRPSVMQAGNPDVIPSRAVLLGVAAEAILEAVR